jgi:hypothetical protein
MGGEEVWLLLILNLGTRWGWVVSVTPRPRFTPGERTPEIHWIGGWVGPRAGLDIEARRKILCLCRGPSVIPLHASPNSNVVLCWVRTPDHCLIETVRAIWWQLPLLTESVRKPTRDYNTHWEKVVCISRKDSSLGGEGCIIFLIFH